MALSFYDASAATYLQTLEALDAVLKKGRSFAEGDETKLREIVAFRLREDMAPFSFQVISVWHHSLGAIRGMKSGSFEPPPKLGKLDYADLQGLIEEARTQIGEQSEEEIDALAGGKILFRVGEREMPFTTENFLVSFSLPNFFFHATTTYAVLRMHGVPLGKRDFLGTPRIDR